MTPCPALCTRRMICACIFVAEASTYADILHTHILTAICRNLVAVGVWQQRSANSRRSRRSEVLLFVVIRRTRRFFWGRNGRQNRISAAVQSGCYVHETIADHFQLHLLGKSGIIRRNFRSICSPVLRPMCLLQTKNRAPQVSYDMIHLKNSLKFKLVKI